MRKWLLRKMGLRQAQQGQTTAEYAIIVALVAVASIAVIMIFGNQIRALFAAESKAIAGEEDVVVDDQTGSVDDEVEGSLKEF